MNAAFDRRRLCHLGWIKRIICCFNCSADCIRLILVDSNVDLKTVEAGLKAILSGSAPSGPLFSALSSMAHLGCECILQFLRFQHGNVCLSDWSRVFGGFYLAVVSIVQHSFLMQIVSLTPKVMTIVFWNIPADSVNVSLS